MSYLVWFKWVKKYLCYNKIGNIKFNEQIDCSIWDERCFEFFANNNNSNQQNNESSVVNLVDYRTSRIQWNYQTASIIEVPLSAAWIFIVFAFFSSVLYGLWMWNGAIKWGDEPRLRLQMDVNESAGPPPKEIIIKPSAQSFICNCLLSKLDEYLNQRQHFRRRFNHTGLATCFTHT